MPALLPRPHSLRLRRFGEGAHPFLLFAILSRALLLPIWWAAGVPAGEVLLDLGTQVGGVLLAGLLYLRLHRRARRRGSLGAALAGLATALVFTFWGALISLLSLFWREAEGGLLAEMVQEASAALFFGLLLGLLPVRLLYARQWRRREALRRSGTAPPLFWGPVLEARAGFRALAIAANTLLAALSLALLPLLFRALALAVAGLDGPESRASLTLALLFSGTLSLLLLSAGAGMMTSYRAYAHQQLWLRLQLLPLSLLLGLGTAFVWMLG